MSTKNENSKIVTVHRSLDYTSRTKSQARFILRDAKMGVSNYFVNDKSSKMATGLTKEEIQVLMPDLLDMESDNKDFRKEVQNYFTDIMTLVPPSTYDKDRITSGGLDLEIGLMYDNDKPITHTVKKGKVEFMNLPINVRDYVIFKHITGHPLVAKSKKDSEMNPLKRFFVMDKQKETQIKLTDADIQDKALLIYMENKANLNMAKQVVLILSKDPKHMSEQEVFAEYRSIATKKPSQFIEVHLDELLELKAFTKLCLSNGVLEEIGNQILISESQQSLGRSVREVAIYLNDKANSDTLRRLKALLEEKINS